MVGDLRGPGTLPRRLLPLAAVGLASAIGYVVLPQLAPASLDPEATVLVLGVVNGIALGLLLRLPARFTPAIAIGATVGVSLSWLLTSATALGSAITGVVVGGELVAIGWIMRRARAARLRDPRDLIVYTITVLAVSSLGATLVVIARSLAGLPLPGGAGSAWGVWVIDDVFGAVVIAPAVLTITWPRGIRWKVALEWMAAAGLSLLLTWQLFFRLEPDARGLFNWPFFVALGSLWIAVRMGFTAVAPVVAVQYWLGAVAAVSGVGVFVSDDVSLLDRLLSYEVLVITFALVTLALAVLHDARAETMRELARSEGLLSDVIDGSPAMVSAKAFGTNGDGGGRYILTNSSWEQFTAVPADEALGHTDVDLWGSAEGGGSVAVERTVVATGRPSDVIEQRTDAMGEVRELQTSTFPLRGPDGEVWGTGTIATDITELARSRRQVEEQAALLFAVFDASPTPAVRLRMEDSGGVRALDSNEAFERLLECDEGCVERTGLLEHVELDDVGWVVDVLEDARSRARGRGSGQQPHGEVRLQSHAGERIWAVMYAATVLGDTDDREIVVQFEDITARKSAEAALLEQATKDSVTGLPNRRVLHERLEAALARLQRHPGYLAVLFCDLDRFKEVNDTLGHQAGDEFLAEVARRLVDGVRPQDTVARLGGDEFVVLAEDLHEGREAITLALRLQDRLSATWEHGGRSFRPAMSVGIALSAAPQVDELEARGTRHRGVDELLRRADLAMYRAKDAGRNRIEMYDIQFDEDVRHSVDIQEELRTAIDRDGLVLAYQPIVDLASGDRVGVEALVRMRAPDGSLRMPDHFIPQAEATGLIVPLGWWVIGRALRDLAEAVPGGDSFVSINVSPVQLREEGLASRFLAAVSAAGLAPQRIVVEVTETALIRDSEHSRRALSELKHAGVRIALDDFGTGYSSLTWLTHFPVDVVKVDRSFTAEVGVDDRRTAVVTAMIAVSHELELTVVAEGVETEAQRALLVEMGCDRGQGYLFGRPELLS